MVCGLKMWHCEKNVSKMLQLMGHFVPRSPSVTLFLDSLWVDSLGCSPLNEHSLHCCWVWIVVVHREKVWGVGAMYRVECWSSLGHNRHTRHRRSGWSHCSHTCYSWSIIHSTETCHSQQTTGSMFTLVSQLVCLSVSRSVKMSPMNLHKTCHC